MFEPKSCFPVNFLPGACLQQKSLNSEGLLLMKSGISGFSTLIFRHPSSVTRHLSPVTRLPLPLPTSPQKLFCHQFHPSVEFPPLFCKVA
jgi:hypothetical protein